MDKAGSNEKGRKRSGVSGRGVVLLLLMVLVIAVVGVSAAGCGEETTTTTAGGTATTAGAAPTGDPVVIGAIVSATGPNSAWASRSATCWR